ncbi:hypothetical protein K469DRAFT_607852, partial [Zopfia rhizophila CBS 207.26]
LVKEFIAKVPKLEFSLAKVMFLLLVNKQLPYNTITSIDTWVERIKEERKKFTRTNS